jgi:hypothetical protein
MMSPHFGLMDPGKMTGAEAALMRAKLHWRGGRRRLREQKTAAGIAALYDALLCGLRWYLLVHRPASMGECRDAELEDEWVLFALGRETGILDETIDLAGIQALVEQALEGGDVDSASRSFPGRIELLLTRIGVLPFDERELPPEDPRTF